MTILSIHNLAFAVLMALGPQLALSQSANTKPVAKASITATKPPAKPPVKSSAKLLARPPIRLEGTKATLVMDVYGCAFSDWRLKDKNINVFDWALKPSDMPKNNQVGPPFRGHFLCLGRWGAPSAGEIQKGIPHNSEANTMYWQVLELPTKAGLRASTQLVLPLDQYYVERQLEAHPTGKSFRVEEKITNLLRTGRIHNVVQHATIGGAFLNPKTLIDCNAGDGFDQGSDPEKLDSLAFRWDNAILKNGGAVNLRSVNDDRGYVTTHLFDKGIDQGWITATDPEHGLLMGYIFPTKEYPWLNVWHWKKDGAPYAHGLEFGTCGLGQPYKLLVEKRVSFRGKNMFDYIDAGETQVKHYMAFMVSVPTDFAGVADLKLVGTTLTIKERGGKLRTITESVVGM